MLSPAGPVVTDRTVRWRVEDDHRRIEAVRLWSDFDLGDTGFAWGDDGWVLEVPLTRLPPVDRLEYLLEKTQEGRTVLLHCVQAQSRTPTVAALYGARVTGRPAAECLAEVQRVLPGAHPNRAFLRVVERVSTSAANF